MWLATEYSATWGHTSVAGDMQVSRRGHGSCREDKVAPRVAPDMRYSSLAEVFFCRGRFYFGQFLS